MGILLLNMQEEVQKKNLPLKPKVTNLGPDPPTFEDPLFSDYNLDKMLEENLGTTDQSVLNTPEPVLEPENVFNSIWDHNVVMGSTEPVLDPEKLLNSILDQKNDVLGLDSTEPVLDPENLFNSIWDQNVVMGSTEPVLNPANVFNSSWDQQIGFGSSDQTQTYIITTVEINEAEAITSINEASEDVVDECWGANSFKTPEVADANEDMDYICSAGADLSTETTKQAGTDKAFGDIADCWEADTFSPICDLKDDVNINSAPPSKATVIAENSNVTSEFQFPVADLDSCWAPTSFDEIPSECPDFPNSVWTTINNNTHLRDDILKIAISESGIVEAATSGKASFSDVDPEVTSASFIQPVGSLPTIGNKTISQYTSNKQLNKTKDTKKFKSAGKRKVGRPERKTPLQITQVPAQGSVFLTPDQLAALKHKRMRDLNNEASKRFRQNRKEKEETNENICQELENANILLKEQFLAKQSEAAVWRAKCRALGYNL